MPEAQVSRRGQSRGRGAGAEPPPRRAAAGSKASRGSLRCWGAGGNAGGGPQQIAQSFGFPVKPHSPTHIGATRSHVPCF